jgi:hypothetical protein
LHDHGIVHRDLKPGNIFSDEGTVKIGDYGLAKFISCSRRSGQTESVGTVHYMAPEIANGRYGREIDTYALGIILFEMLTGRVPFEGESVGEVLMKHLTAEPDLSALAEPYRDIVRRALAKDPEVRLNSVGEMMSLLPGGDEWVPPKPSPSATAAAAPQGKPAVANRGLLKEADAVAWDGFEKAVHMGRSAYDQAAKKARDTEEPIWKAIRENFSGVRLKNLHPVKKGILIFSLVALFLWYSDTVFSLIFPLLICYLIYRAIWSSWAHPDAGGEAASAAGKAATNTAAAASVDQQTIAWQAKGTEARALAEHARHAERRRRVRPTWRDRANRELAAKPLREKLSELLGSMLLAAVFAAVAACVAPLLLANQAGTERLASYLWLATVGTLGSWAILVPSKFAEGKLEDQVPMRVMLMSFGALVGLAGWFVGDTLLLHSPGWGEPIDVGHGLLSHEMLGWPATDEGANPPPAVYLAYFAFLFLLPRWWRQAEYTRSGRLSLWWVFVAVGWAWLLHIFWWFPQPIGIMAAGVIAVATQLASPWMPPSRRRALAAEIEGGVV